MDVFSKKYIANSESTILKRIEEELEVMGFESIDTNIASAKAKNYFYINKYNLFFLAMHLGGRKKFGTGMTEFD